MFILFRHFRKLLLGLVSLLCITCIVLSILVQSRFQHRSGVVLMLCVEALMLIHSLASAYHDVLFGHRQTVGWELAGLVLLFPFSAILTLFVIGVEFKPSSSSLKNAFHALQILVIADAAFLAFYALSLVLISVATMSFFDARVLTREIDSSPSPFPIRYIICRILPGMSSPAVERPKTHSSQSCLPGCNCISKSEPDMIQPSLNEYDLTTRSLAQSMEVSPSRPSSLIRLPDDVERRSSIALTFSV